MNYYGFGNMKRETQDILLAFLVLGFAFSIASFADSGYHVPALVAARTIIVSFIAVGIAFLGHELSHRQVARNYGGWAEFRLWPIGILMALITSFFGIILAAPGAVNIAGVYGNEKIGKTALAGPGFNMLAGFVFLLLSLVGILIRGLGGIILEISYLNFYLGAFNMIPIGPLDGAKVMRWDFRTFAVVFAVLIFMTVLVGFVIL